MSEFTKPPEKPQPISPQEPIEMRHMDAFHYIFSNPNWLSNVLLVMVCQVFIPIVGPIVVLGYQFEIIELLYRKPTLTYPDFEFGRFVDYLKRGVWPFLVSLVIAACSMPIFFVAYILFVVAVVGGSAAGGEEAGAIVAIIGMLAFIVAMFVLGCCTHVVIVPIVLRAGLSQDFGEAFKWSALKRFIGCMWKETIISGLFMMAMGLVAAIAGMALLCIGIYPAMAILLMAQAHIYYQLYRVFVSRGGEPIPMKDDDTVFADIV